MRQFVLLALVVAVAGCQSHKSDEAYAASFFSAMTDFERDAATVAQRPLPSSTSPKAQRRAAIAGRLREDAGVWRKYEKRFAEMKPSLNYAEVNRLSAALFKGMADDDVRWAGLLEARSPEARSFFKGSNARMIAGYERILEAIGKLGGDTTAMKAKVEALKRAAASDF